MYLYCGMKPYLAFNYVTPLASTEHHSFTLADTLNNNEMLYWTLMQFSKLFF